MIFSAFIFVFKMAKKDFLGEGKGGVEWNKVGWQDAWTGNDREGRWEGKMGKGMIGREDGKGRWGKEMGRGDGKGRWGQK